MAVGERRVSARHRVEGAHGAHGDLEDPGTWPLPGVRLNLDGDGQGDLAGHRGEQRAVFVYQFESYRHWQAQLKRNDFVYTFDNIANVNDRFTDVIGFDRFGVYVFDYGAPTGFRLALKHPERITAIISQNGNAYEEGMSEGWNPIRAYWTDPSHANREALRALLTLETTVWRYAHGVPDTTSASPDGYSLDNFYLNRPGADEVQPDLFGDHRSNVSLYPAFQEYFRTHKPPFLAVWGKNDPFFLPAGSEAFKRDIPGAVVCFFETGHFALQTHAKEIALAISDFLIR